MTVSFNQVEHNTPEWLAAVKLREDVLRKPIGSFFSDAELEAEKEHIHVVGYDQGELIATAVLVPEGNKFKMQRVAVLPNSRSQGIGSAMMQYCEQLAREHNKSSIFCHARDTAVNFYLNNSYSGEGDYFDEDGIPHWKMSKLVSL